MPSLSQTESYSYDPVGNRTSQNINGQAVTYSYNSVDELVSAGNTAFTYDAGGNMASKTVGGAVYGYNFDAGNRLLEITLNSNEISRYSYDADGVRVKKVENGSTTVYVNSGLQYLVTITDGVPTKHIYAQGRRVAQVTNGETLYVHTDHLGNTRQLTDAQGNIAATIEYSSFGVIVKADDTHKTLLFIGKELDSSGLYYFGARYYDPATGRFISRDPIQAVGCNPYVYAKYHPLNYIDPDGNFPLLAIGAIVGALVGAAVGAFNSYYDGNFSWSAVAQGAAIGAMVGATLGLGAAYLATGSAFAGLSEAGAALGYGAAASAPVVSEIAQTVENNPLSLSNSLGIGVRAMPANVFNNNIAPVRERFGTLGRIGEPTWVTNVSSIQGYMNRTSDVVNRLKLNMSDFYRQDTVLIFFNSTRYSWQIPNNGFLTGGGAYQWITYNPIYFNPIR